MYLVRLRVSRLGPFEELELRFDHDGEPRPMTVIYGGGGVGKSTIIAAIANTRPGHAIVNTTRRHEDEEPGQVVCDYQLGQDDPERPHPLVVASPNVRVYCDPEQEALRRKEQALFERLARENGYVFVSFPATRHFSRNPLVLSSPGRSMARYDVRAPMHLDDLSRGDLAREAKQCLAYAAMTRALVGAEPSGAQFVRLENAMKQAVDCVLGLVGQRWKGLDPLTLEPVFEDEYGEREPFDNLPTRARHLVAFAALSVRALWAAFPARHPLDSEGVIAIDEVDAGMDPLLQVKLPEALSRALPRVQWLLTTSAPAVASGCESAAVVALRRGVEQGRIEAFTGELAQLH